MARALTERQQKFLAVLMDEAGGDISTAKIMAGYSANTSNLEVTNSLKEEIIDVTHSYLARNVPKAAMAMVGALYDPTELGIRDKMAAAKELLDRTGLVKTEKVQIEAKGGVMLMPAKNPTEEDDCTCGKSMSACTCDD
jgi:phage terminase small subunit